MRHLLPAALVVLAACVTPRHTGVRAPRPLTIATIVVVDRDDSHAVEQVPAEVVKRIADTLAERNLRRRQAAEGLWQQEFQTRRATKHRLDWLAKNADTDLLLLVEAKVSFYSHMNGRYRWVVDGKATLVRRGALDDATTTTFQVPAFLDYEHEREPRALEEAAAGIAEKIGALADTVLGSLPDKPVPAGDAAADEPAPAAEAAPQ
jgi:hypothetical protein